MALSNRQQSRLLDALDGERVGNWVASREGGGHAGWFIYLQHPDVEGTLIAATPDWDGSDILPIQLIQVADSGIDDASCNLTVPVPWTGRVDSDRKRWHYEVAKFVRCIGAPGGPFPSIDHGLPKSMQPTRGDWDAGAKARQAEIFRHMLGLDDNPVGAGGGYFWERSASPEDLRSLQIGTGSEHGDLWVLRSETGKPHLLAEVVGGTVVDVRQRGNRPPTKHAKYIAALEAHLRSGREGNPVAQTKARLLAW